MVRLEFAQKDGKQIDCRFKIALVDHLRDGVDVSSPRPERDASRSAARALDRSRILSASRKHGPLVGNAMSPRQG